MKDGIKKYISTDSKGIDLLNKKMIRSLIRWKGFPYVFQIALLCFFLMLIIIGWQVYTPDGVNDKLFAKSNIVTLSIWGIWWPLMIWIAVTMGRVWCIVCPLEFVSNIFERIGRRIGVRQKSLKKWVSDGAVIVFLYALIQLLISGFHLHRIPAYTSFFLVGLLTTSIFIGVFFKNRTFCRGFCPIGMLLNAYGRGGVISVRASDGATCKECTGKDCILACNKNNFDSRSCPSLLNPPKLNSNKDCLVCGQCIKSCKPDNMQLLLRKPFNRNDAREEKASVPLTLFIILVSGFVTYELTTEWKTAKEIFLVIPNYFTRLIGLNDWAGIVKGIWTIGVFPLIMWIILGFSSKLKGKKTKLIEVWRELVLPTVIIISAGHLIKALAKLNTWVEFLPKSINDLLGENYLTLTFSNSNIPKPITQASVISIVGIVILIVSLIYSFREEKIIYNSFFNSHLLPKVMLFILFLVLVIGIGLK